MSGHVSGILKSHTAKQTKEVGGAWAGPDWVEGVPVIVEDIDVNVQPASYRQIQTLIAGGRRILDTRSVTINSPIELSLAEADLWTFDAELDGMIYECISFDNRSSRGYTNILVSLIPPVSS